MLLHRKNNIFPFEFYTKLVSACLLVWRDFRSTVVSQYPTNEDCLQRLAPNMTYRRPMFKICRDPCASGDDKSEITIVRVYSGYSRWWLHDRTRCLSCFSAKNKRSVDIDCSQAMHMERKLQGNDLRKAITRQG